MALTSYQSAMISPSSFTVLRRLVILFHGHLILDTYHAKPHAIFFWL